MNDSIKAGPDIPAHDPDYDKPTELKGDAPEKMTLADIPADFAEGEPNPAESRVKRMGREVRQHLNPSSPSLNRSWVDLAFGVVIGVGIGYMIYQSRKPTTLKGIMTDSLGPWASKNLNKTVDSVKHSAPVTRVMREASKLRAS